MLGSTKDTDYGRLVKPPRDAGISTQSIYLVVQPTPTRITRAPRRRAPRSSSIR